MNHTKSSAAAVKICILHLDRTSILRGTSADMFNPAMRKQSWLELLPSVLGVGYCTMSSQRLSVDHRQGSGFHLGCLHLPNEVELMAIVP